MKYFIDTEFIEGFHKPLFGKNRHFIDLISIAITTEDGRSYYRLSREYNYNDADDWVKKNVILPLYLKTVSEQYRKKWTVSNFHEFYGYSNDSIAEGLKTFVYKTSAINDPNSIANWDEIKHMFEVKFYGYYADYDWVLFCSLFGRMINLPKGFPMYCNDLKQMLDEAAKKVIERTSHFGGSINLKDGINVLKQMTSYPKQEDEHDALSDAKWNLALYNFISNL